MVEIQYEELSMYPIYIPSKGRPECKTARLLEGLSFSIVVEPQDLEAYLESGYNPLVLPYNNRGIGYCRQWIKHVSTTLGYKYHWQLDDDINSFLLRLPGHRVQHVSAETALGHVEQHVNQYFNIGQAGLNQNSWPPGKDKIKINNLPVQAVLNNNACQASYRDRQPIEDLDYTLQVLKEGWCTLMFDWLRTSCPVIGSNAGGLSETYKSQKKIFNSMQAIVKDFPTMSIARDAKGWHLKKNRIFSTFKQQPKT